MNEQKETGTTMESLMDMLASTDGVIRQKARDRLERRAGAVRARQTA